jgi:hypothetical protein
MKPSGLSLVVLGLVSCAAGGSETGNPMAPISIKMQIRSTDPDTVAIKEKTGGTLIDQAWFSFGVFEFIKEGLCTKDAGADESGPGKPLLVADLAAKGTAIEMEIDKGDYCGVVVPVQHPTAEVPNDAPAELSNYSLILKGKRSDGVTFTLTHAEEEGLEIVKPMSGTFNVGASADPLLLSFDMAVLMKDINLDLAELESDGTIRIDEDRNRELFEKFEFNLHCALTLYADANRNGALDDKDPLLASCVDDLGKRPRKTELVKGKGSD